MKKVYNSVDNQKVSDDLLLPFGVEKTASGAAINALFTDLSLPLIGNFVNEDST